MTVKCQATVWFTSVPQVGMEGDATVGLVIVRICYYCHLGGTSVTPLLHVGHG